MIEHSAQILAGEERATSTRTNDVTLPTQVRFPFAARDFSPRVNFQCRLSYASPYTPRVQSHALTSVRTLKIL